MNKEKLIRYYLFYFATVWLIYSLIVWVRVDWLAMLSGLGIDNPSATIEARAMYGGLEVGCAIFAYLGFFRPELYLRANVVLFALINGFLVVGRFTGIIIDGGTFSVPWGVLPDSWNAGAMYFLEGPSAIIFGAYWATTYRGRRTP